MWKWSFKNLFKTNTVWYNLKVYRLGITNPWTQSKLDWVDHEKSGCQHSSVIFLSFAGSSVLPLADPCSRTRKQAGALGWVQQVCFDLQPTMGVKLSLCNVKLGPECQLGRPAKAWRVGWERAMFSMTNPTWLSKRVGGCLSEEGGMTCAISNLSALYKPCRLGLKKKKLVLLTK